VNEQHKIAERARKRIGVLPPLEAVKLSTLNQWAVRPKGKLGTMGWYPVAWTVCYVTATSEQIALRMAAGRVYAPHK
jgi:hypothetical protein